LGGGAKYDSDGVFRIYAQIQNLAALPENRAPLGETPSCFCRQPR